MAVNDPNSQLAALLAEIAKRQAALGEETDDDLRAAIQRKLDALAVQRDKIERQINTGGGDYFEHVEHLTVAAPDPATDALRAYWTALRKRCNTLPMSSLGGSNEEQAVSLDQVYTQLDTETSLGQLFKDDELAALAQKYADVSDGPLTPERIQKEIDESRENKTPAMVALAHCQRLIVLGDPGSGKSALVEQVAAGLAARRLGEDSPIFGEYSDEDLLGRYPVLIVLRDLAQRLRVAELEAMGESLQNQTMLAAVREQIQTDLRDQYLAEGAFARLESHLQRGEGFLVFDGLDEVPEAARVFVRKAVFAALAAYGDAQHPTRVVITCRKRSYDAALGFTRFREITLAPYDDDKIKSFIQAWYNHQTPVPFTREQADKRIEDLTTAALGDHAELSPNPMLLTTMAVVHRDNERLPTELVELYDKAIDVLLRRWQRNKDVRGKTSDEGGPISKALQGLLTHQTAKLSRVLETVAYKLHCLQSEAGRETEDDAELSYAELVTLLAEDEYLGDLNLAREFLDYVDQRAGLLIGMGGGLPGSGKRPKSYKFPHRTFQEYLAGRRLIWGDTQDQQELFTKHAAEGDFWSVAARLAGDALLLSSSDDKLYFALIRDLTPPASGAPASGAPATTADARAFAWAVRMAAKAGADRARRYCARIKEIDFFDNRFLTSAANLLGNPLLPAKERADVGIALAKLGDPRRAVLDVDALELVPIPAGTFWMGGAESDADGYADERPRHPQTLAYAFKMARYPVTVAQWRQFREADEGYVNDVWWAGLNIPDGHRTEAEEPRFDYANHPAHNVSWYEAVAFCRWLTARWRAAGKIGLDEEFRLPSEAEWERAARGPVGEQEAYRSRPWGDELTAEHANFDKTGIGKTSTVGCFPVGRTGWGCEEMMGNVWEWTCSLWGTDWEKPEYIYPYTDRQAEREDLTANVEVRRVLRGGSWSGNSRIVRAACRSLNDPNSRLGILGFRVVCAPVLPAV